MSDPIWSLAGLTDSNGNMAAHLGALTTLLVPTEVEVEMRVDPAAHLFQKTWPRPPDEPTPCIEYPIINNWTQQLPLKAYEIDFYLAPAPGWGVKERTGGLLDAFLRLDDATDDEVVDFALRWGPLWVCTEHMREQVTSCPWNPVSESVDVQTTPLVEGRCAWSSVESTEHFRQRARELRAAFDIAAHLLQGKDAPAELWSYLPVDWLYRTEDFCVWDQRFVLETLINRRLTLPSPATIQFQWPSDRATGKLLINTGVGFLQLVWLELAQLISDQRSIYVCSGCGHAYVRRKRSPKAGQENFCDPCGKRGARRVWARKRPK